jgi:30S ribosomal protein S31
MGDGAGALGLRFTADARAARLRAIVHSAHETMGKGDKRTRRGKLFKGSHGNTRPRKPNRGAKPKKR